MPEVITENISLAFIPADFPSFLYIVLKKSDRASLSGLWPFRTPPGLQRNASNKAENI